MHRILLEIPSLGIRLFGFGTMMGIAVCAAVALCHWRARRERIDPKVVQDVALWLIIGGAIGARLFYVAQHPETLARQGVLALWKGGIVFYGCVIGGAVGSFLLWLRQRFPWRPMMDVVAPALVLALAIGRVGCFLNGCCFGDTCALPWAVSFPAGSLAWVEHVHAGLISASALHSLRVHPTQLYSVADGLILVVLLSAYYPLRRRDGEVMALLMVTYPITRFLIERLRDDEAVFFAGMTISQNVSLLVFAGGIALWAYLLRQPCALYAERVTPVSAATIRGPMAARARVSQRAGR